MPGRTNLRDGVVQLPENYQTQGTDEEVGDVEPAWDEDSEEAVEVRSHAGVEQMDVATLDNWLLDDSPIEEWVPLRTRNLRVKLRALTEEARMEIEKKAPRKINKQTKRPEPDQQWVQLELIRRSLVEPHVPNRDMLAKALAGELSYLAREIGRISGFNFSEADALG